MRALRARCRTSGPLLADPIDGLVSGIFELTLSYIYICASALLESIVSLFTVPSKNHRCQMLSSHRCLIPQITRVVFRKSSHP
jgi:hypothetical protein